MLQDLLFDLSDDCHEFGEILKETRESKRLSLEQLANMLFITKSTLHRWEEEGPPQHLKLKDVRNIAQVTGCTETEELWLIESFICTLLKQRGILG